MSTEFLEASNLIPLSKAKTLKENFNLKKKDLINPKITEKDVIPDSETFNRSAFDKLLALPGCVGIRIYTGLDEQDRLHSIIVGVNDKGEDLIIPTSGGITEGSNGEVVEEGQRCPPYCSTTSLLNP